MGNPAVAEPATVSQVVEPAVHGICRILTDHMSLDTSGDESVLSNERVLSGSDCDERAWAIAFANPVGAASLLCPDIIFGNRSPSDHQRCRRLHGPLCSLCARRHCDGDQHLQQLRRSRGIEQAHIASIEGDVRLC